METTPYEVWPRVMMLHCWAYTYAQDGNVAIIEGKQLSLATIFELSAEKAIKFFNGMITVGLLERSENRVDIHGWNDDGAGKLFSKIKESNERVRKYRESRNADVTRMKRGCNADVTVTKPLRNALTETETETKTETKTEEKEEETNIVATLQYSAPKGAENAVKTDLFAGSEPEQKPKKAKKQADDPSPETIKAIFEAWNGAKRTVKHRQLSKQQTDAIKGALAQFSQAEIIGAIADYDEKRRNGQGPWEWVRTFCGWSLTDFLKREKALPRFVKSYERPAIGAGSLEEEIAMKNGDIQF